MASDIQRTQFVHIYIIKVSLLNNNKELSNLRIQHPLYFQNKIMVLYILRKCIMDFL